MKITNIFSCFTVVILFFLSSCSIIEPYYLDLPDKKKAEYVVLAINENNHKNQNKPDIYSINGNELTLLLKKNKSNKTLLIFFTYWCPNSNSFLPSFLDEISNVKNLDIYIISPDDWKYVSSYKRYSSKNNIIHNIYLLDVFEYGKKRNPHKKMAKFISEICIDCNIIEGFPSVILFDKTNSIIYKQSVKIESDTILKYLNER
ncbi:MAG: TlpA family protein disulfide reductase [Bacteroidales bacterium]|jgi:hypothetical protein